METPSPNHNDDERPASQWTVAALFEETVDAEHALTSLRKAHQAADRVSLLVRHRQDAGDEADLATSVARDLVAAALGAVANWLSGLAELIVSEQGRYLVAGPMGAALTGISRAQGTGADSGQVRSFFLNSGLSADTLQVVLTEFGFGREEARYVEHRLEAGDILIAMTTPNRSELTRAQRLFGERSAVYIGVVETNARLLDAAGELLAAAPELTDSGGVVVADAVAPIRPVMSEDQRPDLIALRGRTVVTADNEEIGEIEQVLVEVLGPVGPSEGKAVEAALRYVVIGFGGVLRIRRRRVVVPIQLVDLESDPVLLRSGRDDVQRAPAYEDEVPLSRRDEQRIFRHFDVSPYWLIAEGSEPASVVERGEDKRGTDERA